MTGVYQLPHGTAACPPATGGGDDGASQDFEVENVLEEVLEPEESASLSE